VSIYERLQKLSCEKHMITREFVMHPLIRKFTNDQFYNVKLHNGPNVQSVEYNQAFESLKFPIYIVSWTFLLWSWCIPQNGDFNSAVIYGILKYFSARMLLLLSSPTALTS
jgi:hypothetical protein